MCQMSNQISLTIPLKCGENKAIKYCIKDQASQPQKEN